MLTFTSACNKFVNIHNLCAFAITFTIMFKYNYINDHSLTNLVLDRQIISFSFPLSLYKPKHDPT